MTRDTTSREAELDELLIDAEADDEQVQQQPVLLRRPWLLLLGLVLVALNLRPALSSMAPALGQVSQSRPQRLAGGLADHLAGALPGAVRTAGADPGAALGSERVILGILLTLALGILVRSALGVTGCSSAA
jgi:CP family cyanate transporter-like MFS transporter